MARTPSNFGDRQLLRDAGPTSPNALPAAALCAIFGRPMPRKLKSYVTSLGFFDQAIAAPSMKAALAAWGADGNLFHQGFAKETNDPEVVTTMAHPGIVLKRPVGSGEPFREHAALPRHLSEENVDSRQEKDRRKPPSQSLRKIDDQVARKAALAFEKRKSSAKPNVGRKRRSGRSNRSAVSER
ncbi:cell envelope biogenesis protein TolA [Bradyrhizobium sp.]|uniref:cell envelope biogenesis protein TolA n=1 Tax=Bradyrhizobium sp. TaxID=376 RepID=UPI003431DC2A